MTDLAGANLETQHRVLSLDHGVLDWQSFFVSKLILRLRPH